MPTILLSIYAILLIIGGIIGKKKSNSQASLIAGVVSGIMIAIGIYLADAHSIMLGFTITTIVSGLLTIVFIIRLAKTGKMMPSGMLCLLSVLALIISVLQII